MHCCLPSGLLLEHGQLHVVGHLSLTWFLAAGMKWDEAIMGYVHYFHLAVWLIPRVKSITALTLRSVDGDPVAGICFVGNQNLNSLHAFVLGPLVL